MREDYVTSAVSFLRDPKVQSSPIAKKVAFLESKNLTSEEIDEALSRYNAGKSGDSSVSTGAVQPITQAGHAQASIQYIQKPPEPPTRDWRDWFIMATVTGGVGYGLYYMAKRYVFPLIAPPTPPQLEQDKAALAAQFDEAAALLSSLQNDTNELKKSQDEQQKKVDEVLKEVETVVADVKSQTTRREDEIRSVRNEIDTIRELIPKALDKQKSIQSQALTEISNELKSLKSLLASRGGGRPGTTGVSLSNSTPSLNGSTSPTVDDVVASKPEIKSGIPAWQQQPSVPITTSNETNQA